MSSYRGAWDVGPPGAEAEYAGQQAQPAAPPAPTTDPWTGASYAHYPNYDYSYSYPYPYDSSYYQQRAGAYYGNYPAQQGYEYPQRPPEHSRPYRRTSYRSASRSPSGSDRRQAYSRREPVYDDRRRSRSRSLRGKNYSSSDRSSSRSRSYSRASPSRDKKKRSLSSDSSASSRSYRRKSNKRRERDRSLTPTVKVEKTSPPRKKPLQPRSSRTPSLDRSGSKSPIVKVKKEKVETNKEIKKDRKIKDIDPSRKHRDSQTPPHKPQKKTDRSSVTPPKTYKKTERSAVSIRPHKQKKPKSASLSKKGRESSLTPPKSYARGESRSTSKSRSRSSTPRRSKRSPRRSRSQSSSRTYSSKSSRRSRSTSRKLRKSQSRHRSRSVSRSKRRSASRSSSQSRRRSRSRGKKQRSITPKAKSRSGSSHSGSTSEEDRRGQFTVADRKRYWKMHRSRQSEREREPKTPPKELKPPPGAVDSTNIDDIEYRDPPEVEGPNFAELLPPPDQLFHQASTSKKPPIQIKNDGSFLEMFKKMQEETMKNEVEEKKPQIKKPVLPFIGKRRGGRVLKTGLVKKAKAIDEQLADNTPKDAWSLYMQEVKKYRETSCEEERKTRPLVK